MTLKAHFIAPRSITFFDNKSTDKRTTFINYANVEALEFFLKNNINTTENTISYELYAKTTGNGQEKNILLASFNEHKYAQDAVKKLNNQLNKTYIDWKFLGKLTFGVLAALFIAGAVIESVNRLVAPNPEQQALQQKSLQELAKVQEIINHNQKLIEQNSGLVIPKQQAPLAQQPQQVQPPSNNAKTPADPHVNNFLNKLK